VELFFFIELDDKNTQKKAGQINFLFERKKNVNALLMCFLKDKKS
jgi:hypothetical protein